MKDESTWSIRYPPPPTQRIGGHVREMKFENSLGYLLNIFIDDSS